MVDDRSSRSDAKKRTLSLSLSRKKQSSQLQHGSLNGSMTQTQLHLLPSAEESVCASSPSAIVRSSSSSPSPSGDPERPQGRSLGDYVCPICNVDLGEVKSSFLRQRHVEGCLDAQASTMRDDAATEGSLSDEFEYCLFCGKNIIHLDGWRKDAHFGRCMDLCAQEEHAAATNGIEEENGGGGRTASMSFLGQLEICPSCHEFGPFGQPKTVQAKIKHLKQCAKARQMSMQQLLQKLKWIAWGHVPLEKRPTVTAAAATEERRLVPHESRPLLPPKTIRATAVAEDDDDFSSVVLLHQRAADLDRPRKTSGRHADSDDDAFALALALSLSETASSAAGLAQAPPLARSSKRSGATDTASVLSADQSRRVVQRELAQLLYADEEDTTTSRCYCIAPLPPSRLLSKSTRNPSLWQLAATGKDSVGDANAVYRSRFLSPKEG
ncbi:hypothetical protein BX666DRAFT_579524 [Dichotomocladium elegans]|nr:hypothetical protein BX666DRAFT_579524 [Dichotomocladium elegans]